MIAFSAVTVLITIVFGAGNAVMFDTPPPAWLILGAVVTGVVVAYLAARVGRGLLREPAEGRRSGEMALWLGIPVVWLSMWGINLLVTEGQDDPSVFWIFIAPAAAFWSFVLMAAALYMRSRRVRSYFNQSPQNN